MLSAKERKIRKRAFAELRQRATWQRANHVTCTPVFRFRALTPTAKLL